MERIVNKSKSFREAADWDIQQHVAMTPQERIRTARLLQKKVYPDAKDVRECHKND
jgi:hypothetical protein